MGGQVIEDAFIVLPNDRRARRLFPPRYKGIGQDWPRKIQIPNFDPVPFRAIADVEPMGAARSAAFSMTVLTRFKFQLDEATRVFVYLVEQRYEDISPQREWEVLQALQNPINDPDGEGD